MRVIVSVIAASLLGAGAAHGQGVKLYVQKIGTQVITEAVAIKPPPQSTLATRPNAPIGKPAACPGWLWLGPATRLLPSYPAMRTPQLSSLPGPSSAATRPIR